MEMGRVGNLESQKKEAIEVIGTGAGHNYNSEFRCEVAHGIAQSIHKRARKEEDMLFAM